MEYKFNIGDKVKVVKGGNGISQLDVGKYLTITERGVYCGSPGYKVDPPTGNTAKGRYGGFIGENTFALEKVAEEPPKPTKIELPVAPKFKVGDKVRFVRFDLTSEQLKVCSMSPEYARKDGYKIGSIYTVKEQVNPEIRVKEPMAADYYVNPFHFELVTEEPQGYFPTHYSMAADIASPITRQEDILLLL